MRQQVLAPVGMTDSYYDQPLPEKLWPMAAVGHGREAKPLEGRWRVFGETFGGLWTTPSDLAQVVTELQAARAGRSTILSRETVNLMLTAVAPGPFGLGLDIQGAGEAAHFRHGGINTGYEGLLIGSFDAAHGAVFMSNAAGGQQLGFELFRSIAAEYGWPYGRQKVRVVAVIDPRALQDFVGRYELRPGAIMTVTVEGGKLFGQLPGREKFELLPESKTQFFARDNDDDYVFVRDQDGRVTQMNNRSGGRDIQARKVE